MHWLYFKCPMVTGTFLLLHKVLLDNAGLYAAMKNVLVLCKWKGSFGFERQWRNKMNKSYKIIRVGTNKEKTGTEICHCGKCTSSSFRCNRETRRRICFQGEDTKFVWNHGGFEDPEKLYVWSDLHCCILDQCRNWVRNINLKAAPIEVIVELLGKEPPTKDLWLCLWVQLQVV